MSLTSRQARKLARLTRRLALSCYADTQARSMPHITMGRAPVSKGPWLALLLKAAGAMQCACNLFYATAPHSSECTLSGFPRGSFMLLWLSHCWAVQPFPP